MVVNPFQDKKAKIYFKKNEFFLPSNSSKFEKEDIVIFPNDFKSLNEEEKEHYELLKEKIDNTIKQYPQHNFLSFISAVRINKE